MFEVNGWVFLVACKLHDLFFLANKKASFLLKGCLELSGSKEYVLQRAEIVRHVRHHE